MLKTSLRPIQTYKMRMLRIDEEVGVAVVFDKQEQEDEDEEGFEIDEEEEELIIGGDSSRKVKTTRHCLLRTTQTRPEVAPAEYWVHVPRSSPREGGYKVQTMNFELSVTV
jgi:hypothetical protein